MAKYVISHVGKKGTQVAHEVVEARTKALALEVYLKCYCKQTADRCEVVKADKDAEVTLPRPRKAKVETVKAEAPKAKTAKTGTTEYGAKAKANAQAKAGAREGHPELFEAEIKAVKKFKGVGTYFEGTWMYVTGVTREDKATHEALKAMGFRFSGKRMAWYKVGKQVETPAPAPVEEPKVTEVKARKPRKAKAETVKAEEPTKAIASKNAKASKARKAESAKAKVKAPKKIA